MNGNRLIFLYSLKKEYIMEVTNKEIKTATNDSFHSKILISFDIKITTENIKNVEYIIPAIKVFAIFKIAINCVPYLLRCRKI